MFKIQLGKNRAHIILKKLMNSEKNVLRVTVKFLQTLSKKRRIELFLDLCKQGPTCVCVICNRCLYKKCVKVFNESDYEIDMERLVF